MEVIKGAIDHADAVAVLWNAKAQDEESWWLGSPAKTATDIAALLSRGFSLVVASDGRTLIGFGLWNGPRLLGFTTDSREAFFKMMRVWAQEYPGQRGLSVIPARDTREKRWMDELGVAEMSPMGYKPLARGDDPTARKPWTLRCEGSLDAALAAIDAKLAEVAR